MKNGSQGLTFLEMLIVASCVGLIVVVALPAYQTHKGRQRIPELAQAASSRLEAIERVIDAHLITELEEIDGGVLGIPDNVTPTATLHGAQVVDGQITMTWKYDSTFMHGTTYVLTVLEPKSPVSWEVGGSCLPNGVC